MYLRETDGHVGTFSMAEKREGEVGEGGVRRTGAWFPNQSVADHDHLRPAAFRPLHEAISSRSVP